MWPGHGITSSFIVDAFDNIPKISSSSQILAIQHFDERFIIAFKFNSAKLQSIAHLRRFIEHHSFRHGWIFKLSHSPGSRCQHLSVAVTVDCAQALGAAAS
ncbi:hypothetical protein MtrunA17_Chr7g0216651 [Medicago truncatula]|uniref:Uncharacterized protein n=1 Tax=Medicago truncatula TaxID=3880 RepID=A2Q5V7_MEDTR|nr:hypothetical protein MtrDRAFT_AC169177g21v1 [Medicago truncatula]RHN44186.1 hypothetical protein MtrunA17_Chr7g0216651 [Medicago truncatula]